MPRTPQMTVIAWPITTRIPPQRTASVADHTSVRCRGHDSARPLSSRPSRPAEPLPLEVRAECPPAVCLPPMLAHGASWTGASYVPTVSSPNGEHSTWRPAGGPPSQEERQSPGDHLGDRNL